MNNRKYNSGEIYVGAGSKNRFISSDIIRDEKKSSIAIIGAVLVLAIIVCTFFAVFGGFSVPSWKSEHTTATTQKPKDPLQVDKKFPYATVTDRINFIGSEGGKGLYQLDINSDYAILVRLSDMVTLGHKYADEIIYPASMTKVMTVVVALDLIENLDDEYIITREILNTVPQGASSAWLSTYVGSKVSVRDLLYGISYMSGADSVLCLLDYLGLSINEFAALMNAKADEIGLQNTTFGGAIGMDTEMNLTTCRDVAAIMAYAMENPLCVELFGGLSYKLDFIDMTYYNSTLSKTLNNMGTNPGSVLGDGYTLIAAKSGLEDKAGYCLVSYIRNDLTGEYFVLVTAKADRSDAYPPNKNTILDMAEIFESLKP